MEYSTITLPTDQKRRLAMVKGDKSWTEFMDEVLENYPVDDLIKKLEERIADLRTDPTKFIPWSEVEAKMAARRKKSKK